LIQLQLFGAVSIQTAEGNDLRSALVQSKRTALLAYLAVARPRTSHRRENLLALFWPELSEDRARRALNQAIYYLRSKLGPDSIIVAGDELSLARDRISCDVIEFENLLDSRHEEEALALYRGDLLSGFHLNDMMDFEHWVEAERSFLRDRAARAARLLADCAADEGSAHDAIHWARRSLDLSRDETAVRHLMAMRDRFGDRAGAIMEYDRFARQLTRELEADPSPETQALIAQIRARSGMSTPGTGTPSLPRPAIVTPVAGTPAIPAAPSDQPQPPETAAPEAVIEERRAGRRRLGFLIASLLVVLLAAAALVAERERRRPAIIPGSVAVLPFSYTGSIDHADAAEAVVNLLDANIAKTSGVRTIDWRSVKSFIDRTTHGEPLTLPAASAAAQRFKAQWYIVGSVAEAGDRLRVTAAVYDREAGDSAGVRAVVEGNPEHLFEMVDELTAKVIAARETGPNARLYRSAILTTSSAPALKSYLDGERDFRAARYISALQNFRQAVASDSAFSLAYFRLSQSAELTGEEALARWAGAQALRQSHGLGRYEKEHAEAWVLELNGHVSRAEVLYRGLIARDSTDIEALQQLASIHYNWGPRYGHPAEETGREWRHLLNLDPYNPVGLLYLARISARQSNRTDFSWIEERIKRFDPESDRALELNALKAFVLDDSTSRSAALRDMATATEEVRERVIVGVLTSGADLSDAAQLAARYITPQDAAAGNGDYSPWLNASISAARGRIHEALAHAGPDGADNGMATLERGAIGFVYPHSMTVDEMKSTRDRLLDPAFTPRRDRALSALPDYVAGLLDIRVADIAAARAQAQAVETQRNGNPEAPRLARLLRAEITRAAGDPVKALAILGNPVADGPRVPSGFPFALAHERYLRAELLREQNRTAEALRWYATFPDPAGYDLWFLGPAWTHLADSYSALGDERAAGTYFSRVVQLWRDADASLQAPRVKMIERVKAAAQR
jgi:DNA-binding SARP family transcriptional activator/TolB-like protein